MGAYLFFKVADSNQADEFNKFMSKTNVGKRLINAEAFLSVIDSEDIEFAKKEQNKSFLEYYMKHKGHGEFKASGVSEEEIKLSECKDLSDFFDLITEFFVVSQTKFELKFGAYSCAFNPDEYYFTIEQMKRITQNGRGLSGESINPEKYNLLKKLLEK